MSEKFSLVIASHKHFGALPGAPPRRFTLQEALIVSRALDAVAMGASPERQIFISPIASDCDFEAHVEDGGIVVSGAEGLRLDWAETRALSEALRSFAGEGLRGKE